MDFQASSTYTYNYFTRCDLNGLDFLQKFILSFPSVFSSSISAIKGRSARARVLIIIHGFVVYDIMGLTLSKAVALIQSQ